MEEMEAMVMMNHCYHGHHDTVVVAEEHEILIDIITIKNGNMLLLNMHFY